MYTEPSITGFHAHVYYDPTTRANAARVRDALDARFAVRLGRWHDAPIGPHPRSMYQVAFAPEVFAPLVTWLMLHRDGLDVLVHPETGDDLADHRDNALWLGEKLPLNFAVLRTRATAS
jgi:aromatic ring-cleaving dioxygenase